MTKFQSLLVFLLLLTFSHVFAQLTVSLPATVYSCSNPYSMAVNPTSGTPPYTYSWSNGSTAQVVNITQSGIYTVVVSDAAGATATATTNVSISPPYSLSPLASTQCASVPMTLSLNPINGGGLAPYTINWGDGNTSNVSTTSATHMYMWPALYTLYVTDANGCQVSTTVDVQPTCGNVDLGPDQFLCITGGPQPIFAMGNFAAGSTYEWFDGNGQNLNNPSNVYMPPFIGGQYCVVVTEPNGTVHSDCVQTIPVMPPTIDIVPSANCLPTGGVMDLCAVISPGSSSSYTTQWNNGAISNCITVGTAGFYTCLVSDMMASNCFSTDTIMVVDCSASTSVFAGMAYFDANTNNVFDAGDAALPYHAVTLAPTNTTIFTNASGDYSFSLDTMQTFTISTGNVATFSPATPTYTIQFPNSGMQSIGNDFAFPPINDVRCYLTPYSNAVPGFPLYYNLYYDNYGQFAANGVSLSCTYDPNVQFVYSVPAPTSISGNTLTWNIGTLAANANGMIELHLLTPSTLALGTVLTNSAQILPTTNDINIANNSSFSLRNVIGSWDPNAKSVSLSEMSLPLALSGKKLEYMIQFQNTGTAPAQKVVVMDTLDTKLDVLSFDMLVASHQYSLELVDNHILKWTFDNIQLADSVSNEPESHGFIRYQIATTNTVAIGDIIHNKAAIYFDFNTPIFTGDAPTTIVSKSAIDETAMIGKISVAPNPIQDKCVVSFASQANNIKEAQINLYNMNGKLVYSEKVNVAANNFQKEIVTKSLAAGVYFIQVVTENGTLNQKLVKE